jgi:hypothetical protein
MHDPEALDGMTTHPRLIQYIGDIHQKNGTDQ